MSTITIIYHDGYKEWNVTGTKTVQVVGDFSLDTCLEALSKAEGENFSSWDEINDDRPVKKNNVVTCMGEESGITFVGS